MQTHLKNALRANLKCSAWAKAVETELSAEVSVWTFSDVSQGILGYDAVAPLTLDARDRLVDPAVPDGVRIVELQRLKFGLALKHRFWLRSFPAKPHLFHRVCHHL